MLMERAGGHLSPGSGWVEGNLQFLQHAAADDEQQDGDGNRLDCSPVSGNRSRHAGDVIRVSRERRVREHAHESHQGHRDERVTEDVADRAQTSRDDGRVVFHTAFTFH